MGPFRKDSLPTHERLEEGAVRLRGVAVNLWNRENTDEGQPVRRLQRQVWENPETATRE
jgi:hypothetical protein